MKVGVTSGVIPRFKWKACVRLEPRQVSCLVLSVVAAECSIKTPSKTSRPILPQRAKNTGPVMPVDVACDQAEFAQISNGLRSCEQNETVLWNFCYTARSN